MGFTGLALGSMLFRDGLRADTPASAWRPPDGKPAFYPEGEVGDLDLLCGGVSHLESFDVKPALNEYSGKSIDETPFKDVLATRTRTSSAAIQSQGPQSHHAVADRLQAVRAERARGRRLVSEHRSCADDIAVCSFAMDDPQ
jgi:hypothetical protein